MQNSFSPPHKHICWFIQKEKGNRVFFLVSISRLRHILEFIPTTLAVGTQISLKNTTAIRILSILEIT
jgi:hypothetical protein